MVMSINDVTALGGGGYGFCDDATKGVTMGEGDQYCMTSFMYNPWPKMLEPYCTDPSDKAIK
jgi:hypothetical protein